MSGRKPYRGYIFTERSAPILTAAAMAQHFIDARLADLTVAQSLFTKALQESTVPAWEDVPLNALYTTLAAAVVVQLLLAMLSRRGRRIIFDTVETVLAVILIVVLLAVVIGLPIGEEAGRCSAGMTVHESWPICDGYS